MLLEGKNFVRFFIGEKFLSKIKHTKQLIRNEENISL